MSVCGSPSSVTLASPTQDESGFFELPASLLKKLPASNHKRQADGSSRTGIVKESRSKLSTPPRSKTPPGTFTRTRTPEPNHRRTRSKSPKIGDRASNYRSRSPKSPEKPKTTRARSPERRSTRFSNQRQNSFRQCYRCLADHHFQDCSFKEHICSQCSVKGHTSNIHAITDNYQRIRIMSNIGSAGFQAWMK